MIELKKFKLENYNDYLELYNEFLSSKSDLVPDVLELPCNNIDDYKIILQEIENRLLGNHTDNDWYLEGHYYLVYDNNKLIGVGCIRNKLSQKGYDIWGNIALGVRPSERKKGYGKKILNEISRYM